MSEYYDITPEYCWGITEGRLLLKSNPEIGVCEIKDIVFNLKSTMKEFRPGPVKDLLKGELDFWKLQLGRRSR